MLAESQPYHLDACYSTLKSTFTFLHVKSIQASSDSACNHPKMSISENKQRMARGELYHAFTPELTAERQRCKYACARYSRAGEVSRRKLCELFREYV